MVGIIIVSHSHKVAEGVKDIALQMVTSFTNIKAVGGLENGEIGTDPEAIQEAIESLDATDGIVLFADLGSAIMSISVAKELLPEELSNKLYLANAPLVEGTVLGVIEAAMGSSVEKILDTVENGTKVLEKTL